MRKEAINEVKILASLKSPYCTKYYDSFYDKNKLNIIMEYCPAGDLSQYLRKQMGRPLKENLIWK